MVSGSGAVSEGVKALQVSMPVSSRTELGDKTVDGKYPVAWCEGDVLAVNGKPTLGIKINEEAANIAVFDLPFGITIPYHIVYPYPGEGVAINAESGSYPVVFASEQQYTEGTFAPNSAPMYAWSNGFDNVQMEHLATALRFAIKAKAGESVTLKYVSVSTVGAEPISGVFDVYCADNGDIEAGTIKAREGASSVVFYNFEGDSYTLTSEESAFYIAVPKGSYSSFEVNFVAQDGSVCVRTFDANGELALNAGKVREFPLVEFEANSKMLLVGSDADMETFANEVKAGTFSEKYDGALLVNDIDMTDKAWTSVEGYDGLFEGRGYTIKGLTTPLFGENVVANISNVNVEGNVVEATLGKVGIIARSLSADGDKVGTIFNCSAKGSIEYKNVALAVNSNYDLINVGGVVGGVYGGSVKLSTSNVDVVVVTSAGEEAQNAVFTPCVGGVVGYACAKDGKEPEIVENTNNGAVVWDDNSNSIKVTPYIGGVAGYVTAGVFTDNVNTGALSVQEPMFDLDWGGVLGASTVNVERCENKGSLTINEQITKANIGGVLGKLERESALNCENSGQLYFGENFKINSNCNIGGVIAYAEKGTKEVKDCSNSGSINYLGSCYYQDRATINGNANIVLGGVVGTAWSELVSNCSNKNSAILNIAGSVAGNGDIKRNLATIDKNTAIAGVIGVRAGKKSSLGTTEMVKTENCKNEGNVNFKWDYCGASYIFSSACIGIFESDYITDCSNAGSVTVEANVSTDTYTHPTTSTLVVFISGMFGYISDNCDEIHNCSNSGVVKVSNSNSRMMWVSGLLGTAKSGISMKFDNCGNTGDILVEESVNLRNVYVGGILANTLDIKLQYPNCYNSGSVESKAVVTSETFLGAIFGFSTGSDTGEGTEGIYNSGRVIYSGKSAMAYVGGYCGQYKENNHSVQFENRVSGVVEYNGEASFKAFVGGIVGLGATATMTLSEGVATAVKSITGNTGGKFQKGMINNGNVTIYGYAPEVYVGGCFGYIKTTGAGTSNLNNNGKVEIPDMSTAEKFPECFYMGGIFGYASFYDFNTNTGLAYPTTEGAINEDKAISDCNNTGDIIYKGIATNGAFIGGIGGWAYHAPIHNCTNDGEIISAGHAGNLSPLVGTEGVEKATAHQYRNMHCFDIAVGGIVGETDLDMAGCVNNGDVTHDCLLSPLRVSYLGDLATSRFDVGGIAGRVFTPEENTIIYKASFEGLINNGDVLINGEPSATLCSPSADTETNGDYQWTDVDDNDRQNKRLFTRVNAAGLIGRMMDLSHMSGASGQNDEPYYYISGSTNNGKVSVPNAGGAKCLSVAGGVADVLVSHLYFTGVRNTGKISIENAGVGTVIKSTNMIHAFFINMGGIVATYFDWRIMGNTTDITKHEVHLEFNGCTNEGDIHYGEVGASVYQCAGGILGQVLHTGADRCVSQGRDGFTGGKWYKTQAQVKFTNCKNSGNIDYRSIAMNLSDGYNYNYAGGILGTSNMGHGGFVQNYGNTNVTIDHCENSGSVQWDRNNTVMSTNKSVEYTAVGGIVGHYCGGIGHSTNGDTAVGGNLGTRENGCNATIISCKNSGRIHGFSGMIGGIIGCGSWYVRITGTEDDPTINTGDIVVIREGGKVVTGNRYGDKPIYAGGIAGTMREYTSAAYAVKSSSASDNNARPDYMPEHMYCRIEYAVNEGAVGGSGYAGGIAGYYYSAVKASQRDGALCAHRGGLENCRNTGAVYCLENATTNVGAIVGMPRMFTYTANTGNDVAIYLSDNGPWPVGVLNCQVGGTVYFNSANIVNVDATNYMNSIYGDIWASNFESIVDEPYDGCVFYDPNAVAPEETPEEGGENEPTAIR